MLVCFAVSPEILSTFALIPYRTPSNLRQLIVGLMMPFWFVLKSFYLLRLLSILEFHHVEQSGLFLDNRTKPLILFL